jgi:hypothetical protein
VDDSAEYDDSDGTGGGGSRGSSRTNPHSKWTPTEDELKNPNAYLSLGLEQCRANMELTIDGKSHYIVCSKNLRNCLKRHRAKRLEGDQAPVARYYKVSHKKNTYCLAFTGMSEPVFAGLCQVQAQEVHQVAARMAEEPPEVETVCDSSDDEIEQSIATPATDPTRGVFYSHRLMAPGVKEARAEMIAKGMDFKSKKDLETRTASPLFVNGQFDEKSPRLSPVLTSDDKGPTVVSKNRSTIKNGPGVVADTSDQLGPFGRASNRSSGATSRSNEQVPKLEGLNNQELTDGAVSSFEEVIDISHGSVPTTLRVSKKSLEAAKNKSKPSRWRMAESNPEEGTNKTAETWPYHPVSSRAPTPLPVQDQNQDDDELDACDRVMALNRSLRFRFCDSVVRPNLTHGAWQASNRALEQQIWQTKGNIFVCFRTTEGIPLILTVLDGLLKIPRGSNLFAWYEEFSSAANWLYYAAREDAGIIQEPYDYDPTKDPPIWIGYTHHGGDPTIMESFSDTLDCAFGSIIHQVFCDRLAAVQWRDECSVWLARSHRHAGGKFYPFYRRNSTVPPYSRNYEDGNVPGFCLADRSGNNQAGYGLPLGGGYQLLPPHYDPACGAPAPNFERVGSPPRTLFAPRC